jgi:hypothetical protein
MEPIGCPKRRYGTTDLRCVRSRKSADLNPSTHCLRGWLVLRAGLDFWKREKPLATPRIRTPHSPVHSRIYTDYAISAPVFVKTYSNSSRTAGVEYLKGISADSTKAGVLRNRLSIPCDGKDVLLSAFRLALDGVKPPAQWLTDAVSQGAKTTGAGN